MSQELLQKPKEELQPPEVIQEARIISVESRIDRISIGKTAHDSRGTRNERFNFEADIREEGLTDDTLRVKYGFSFGRPSDGRASQISGEAAIRFSHLGPNTDLRSLREYLNTQMAIEIFRKNFESIYLLHSAVGMEAPSPWIIQDVRLS